MKSLYASSALLMSLTLLSGVSGSSLADDQPNPADANCTSFYSKLYGKPTIRAVIAFGFIDAPRSNTNVGDVDYNRFVKTITGSCWGGRQDCGFTQDQDNSMLYTKTITIDGQSKNIQLYLANINTEVDPTKSADDQQLQSSLARDIFLGGIQSGSDIVFYYGHSREGGGPDFSPAKTLPTGDFDYAWYEAHQMGINDVYTAFDRAKTKPLIYGSFSCDSEHHWLEGLKRHAPETFLILTQRVSYFTELFPEITNSFDAILKAECPSQMQSFAGSDLYFGDM